MKKRSEIKGNVAGSGKIFICYQDSSIEEIQEMNPELTIEESEMIFNSIQEPKPIKQ
ncbi:hypothetical protein [Dysgonomonas sp. 520]|uniref:hypothetical protein n=1 Tax=Dysgonomonas sp. 520 TaxID=2302931 RepID=UPI0013D2C9F6|nr:hypothetical protein [Dysgonomonas sp. 520]